jgi:hypothetical protein
LVFVIDEGDAFLGWINQGLADHFKNFRSFEKTVEIAIVDGGLRVEVYSEFVGLHSRWLEDGWLLVCNVLNGFLHQIFNFFCLSTIDTNASHHIVRAVLGIWNINAILVVELGHVFPPIHLLFMGKLLPKEVLSQLLFYYDLPV